MHAVCQHTSCTWLAPYIHTSHMGAQKQTELPQPPLPPFLCPAPLGPVLFMGREWLLRAWSQQNCPDRWQHLLFLSSKSFKPATKRVVWPQRSESFLYLRVCCLWGNSVFIFVTVKKTCQDRGVQMIIKAVTSAKENKVTSHCCLWCLSFLNKFTTVFLFLFIIWVLTD